MVLAEGIADVEREGEVVNTLGPGDYFGEIALVTEAPHRDRDDAEPLGLFVLDSQAFRSLLPGPEDPAARDRRRRTAARALAPSQNPRPLRVRQPRRSGKRQHATLSFSRAGAELAERIRDVAAEDDEAVRRVDEDRLMPARVTRRRQEPDSR